MAKRHQETQLTKDIYEGRAGNDEGGPSSIVEPAEMATAEVMKARIIKQPKSRYSSSGARPSAPQSSFSFAAGANISASTAPNGFSGGGGLFGSNGTSAPTPAPPSPTKNPFAIFNQSTTPAGKPVGAFAPAPEALPKSGGIGLFGTLGSTTTSSGGLFGSNATIGAASKSEGGLFGTVTKASNSDGLGSFAPEKKTDGPAQYSPLFGKSPVALNSGNKDSGDVTYPTLPPIPSSIAASTSSPVLNGVTQTSNSTTVGAFDISAPPPDLNSKVNDKDQAEVLWKIKALNCAFKQSLQIVEEIGDWRILCNQYLEMYDNVMSAVPAKRKDVESSSASGSPKRSKTEQAGSAAAKLFGDIVNKTVGPSAPAPAPARAPAPVHKFPVPKSSVLEKKAVAAETKASDAMPSAPLFDFQPPTPSAMPPKGGPKLATTPLFGFTPPAASAAPVEERPSVKEAKMAEKPLYAFTPPAGATVASSDGPKLAQRPLFSFKPPSATEAPPAAGPKLAEKPRYEFKPPAAAFAEPARAPVEQAKFPEKPLFDFKPPSETALAPAIPTAASSVPVPAPASVAKMESPKVAPVNPATTGSLFSNAFGGANTLSNMTSSETQKSNIFGSGGAVDFSAPAAGGGLFANLKPEPSTKRDLGEEDEEDSPKKPAPTGLFGRIEKPAPPAFSFGSSLTKQTPEKQPGNAGGLFGSPAPFGGDQTWKMGSPIKFGQPAASTTGGTQFGGATSTPFSTTTTPAFAMGGSSPASNFPTFGTPAITTPASLTTQQTSSSASMSTSLENGAASGVSTPATASDIDTASTSAVGVSRPGTRAATAAAAAAAGPSTGRTSAATGEPSDDVPVDNTDWSGPGPGEEDEDVLFSNRAAVYQHDRATNGYKKVAVGAIRVLKNRETGAARVVVRTSQGKCVFNVRLMKDGTYMVGKTGTTVTLQDWSGVTDGGKPVMYSLRLKKEEDGKELGRVMNEAKL